MSHKKLVIILGMHRSGTSLITRLCNMLGMGIEAGRLVEPLSNDNETGFWELQEIVDVNESVLELFGLTHLDPSPMPDKWYNLQDFQSHKEIIRNTILEGINKYHLFGVKDPRICRLLPLWLYCCDELDIEPVFIYAIRNPLEVANSLHNRNHIPIEQGLSLWKVYNEEAELNSRGYKRHFVFFSDILQNWRNILPIAENLGFEWQNNPDNIEEQVNSFIRPNLVHHNVEDELLDNNLVSKEIVDLYTSLKKNIT